MSVCVLNVSSHMSGSSTLVSFSFWLLWVFFNEIKDFKKKLKNRNRKFAYGLVLKCSNFNKFFELIDVIKTSLEKNSNLRGFVVMIVFKFLSVTDAK